MEKFMNKSLKSLRRLSCFTFALLVSQTFAIAEADQSSPSYRGFPFTLEHSNDRIVPIDLDGDGLKDLVTADKQLLSIYFQKAITSDTTQPFTFDTPDITLDLPGSAAGWDLDWNTQAQSTQAKSVRIVALIDGKRVLAWPLEKQVLGEAQILLDQLPGTLPLGAYPLNFVRDINQDQRNDFIIPGAEHHNLYLQNKQGTFSGDIRIKSNLWVQSTLGEETDLTDDIGQRVRIPEFRIRDINGDGKKDLISRANNVLETFLANSDGSYSIQPSYSFDLNAVRERVGEPDLDNLDFSNLSAMTRYSYNIDLNDVNGDNIDDLLLREGNKVVFYGGTPTGMNFEKPLQVLRSSGNLIASILLDEDEDDLKDLWLLRVEDISLGKAFVWLALSGSINIEAFIYKNQGQRFASRPYRKKTITINFPSMLSTIGMASEFEELSESDAVTRTLAASLRGTDSNKDLVILKNDRIAIHLDVLEQALSDEELFLGLIDDIREKDKHVIDIGDILSDINIEGQANLAIVKGKQADLELPFDGSKTIIDTGSDIIAIDFNNDQHDDILVFSQRDEERIEGILFLSDQ